MTPGEAKGALQAKQSIALTQLIAPIILHVRIKGLTMCDPAADTWPALFCGLL